MGEGGVLVVVWGVGGKEGRWAGGYRALSNWVSVDILVVVVRWGEGWWVNGSSVVGWKW